MLSVRDLHVSYGGIRALKGVTLEVNQGEIVTIIGANGAGKSTLLNSISGFLKPTKGEIVFKGERLGRQPPVEYQQGENGAQSVLSQVVGRVEEGQIGATVGQVRAGEQGPLDRLGPYRHHVAEAQRLGIEPRDPGSTLVRVDEGRPGGPPAQRLQPEGAGTGIQVEHPSPVEDLLVFQAREEGLADPVGGRARRHPCGSSQSASTDEPTDDAGHHPRSR